MADLATLKRSDESFSRQSQSIVQISWPRTCRPLKISPPKCEKTQPKYRCRPNHWATLVLVSSQMKNIYISCNIRSPEWSCLCGSTSVSIGSKISASHTSVANESHIQPVADGFSGNFETGMHRANIRWSGSQNKRPLLWCWHSTCCQRCAAFQETCSSSISKIPFRRIGLVNDWDVSWHSGLHRTRDMAA